MRIRTLLNKFEYLKSFVYKKEYIEESNGHEKLIIEIVMCQHFSGQFFKKFLVFY